jgi:hypothetical protein
MRVNLVLTLALTCVLSPGERISPIMLWVYLTIVRPIPSPVLPKTQGAVLLLLGEKAGMREDVKPFSLGNGFWRDAGNGHRDGHAPR